MTRPNLQLFVPKLVIPLPVKLLERINSTTVGGMLAVKPWKADSGSVGDKDKVI